MKMTTQRMWRENKGLLLFIVLMVAFRSAFADWNSVPTGSMKPTIIEGDRIWINKLAYDIRAPFSATSIHRLADPERGDIVVFNSKTSKIRLVKRVVGLPGDEVSMRNNKLILNGKPVAYRLFAEHEVGYDLLEDLPGAPHAVRIMNRPSSLASFPTIKIPAEHYLVLGDNRNNSADSRVIGLVPRSEIIGRTRSVVMSLNYDNYYLPRSARFFKPL